MFVFTMRQTKACKCTLEGQQDGYVFEGKVFPLHVMKELLAEKTPERVWTFSIREIYPALPAFEPRTVHSVA
jgi:hypothetical protein